ncbi:MAG: hypothetical protein JWS10_2337 [Cypionkella sp.]|uniref:hypothetical protein n=1 Tax=Cypionkella sp. TaxID=2811411 RepID=UPI0026038D7B|nr:hypothetical protein [Cypionkella sp.]MDB5659722.1 hypothetical protein [Cypionkella sp.]
MPSHYIAKARTVNHPSGERAEWFEIYDIFDTEGIKLEHVLSDGKAFGTREEAEAWIAANSTPD